MIRGSNNRRIFVGIGSMVAGAALLVGALPGGATPAGEASTTSSSVVNDPENPNPTCGDFGYDNEFKIDEENPEPGDYEDPDSDLVVTITAADYDEDPATVSLTTSFPVSAVFLKAGPGGVLYTADPPATVWNNLESDRDSISHISVCWNDDDETTTTTAKDTTTTSEKDTTTTTAKDTTTTSEKDTTTTSEKDKETTTTVEGETTTTMAGVTTTTPGGELPRTGNNAGPLVALGALLLAGGTALVAGTKWRRAQQ